MHGAARAGFKVLFVGEARLAEMHLGVDHARQQMQVAAFDHLGRRGVRKVADGRESAAPDAEIAQSFPVLVDDGAALEDQVVGFGHI